MHGANSKHWICLLEQMKLDWSLEWLAGCSETMVFRYMPYTVRDAGLDGDEYSQYSSPTLDKSCLSPKSSGKQGNH